MKNNKNNQQANQQGSLGGSFVAKKRMDKLMFKLAEQAGLAYCGDGRECDEDLFVGNNSQWNRYEELKERAGI